MPGEKTVPNELTKALATGNRLQDILTNQFKTGRTGNEMLLSALEQAKSEGINPQIYTHPIGYYGHGAGTMIGMQTAMEFLKILTVIGTMSVNNSKMVHGNA